MKITHKKLGRHKAWGLADKEAKTVELDIRLQGRKHLEIAIHEALHIVFPDMSETIVARTGRRLANVLWQLNYRRVDNRIK